MSAAPVARPLVANAKRVLIKLGTRVLTHADGRLALARLFRVVEVAAHLRDVGRDVLLVSSGAVGLGRDALRLETTPADLAERQACAAVGQSRLMELYQQGFDRLGLVCAQLLLTEDDFDDRSRYLNLRSALSALLRRGVVPVINENDVVATAELAISGRGEGRVVGDNDRLSALVASELACELLILCTDIDGVYDQDPRHHPDARLLHRFDDDSPLPHVGGPGSEAGRGGMVSKLNAARLATQFGCHAVILSGLDPVALEGAVRGDDVGTWFPAKGALNARQRWIGFASRARGVVHIDAGAVRALQTRRASLLAAGVTHLKGEFAAGDVVEIRGPDHNLVARGISRVSAAVAENWLTTPNAEGKRPRHILIRTNHMVLMGETDNDAAERPNNADRQGSEP